MFEDYEATNDSLAYQNDTYENILNGFTTECGVYFTYFLNLLGAYYLPVIIVFGLVGNMLSCVVFLSTHLKMRSSSYYLAALAVTDFGYLSILLVNYLNYISAMDLYNREGWCQVFVYISGVCSTLSTWLIVAFTVERFIAVQYPLQRPYMCTVSRAKLILTVLSLVALLSQLYLFWTAGIVKQREALYYVYYGCDMRPEYKEFMKIVNFIDTITTLVVPLILIVTMNTMISRNLLVFKKRFRRDSSGEGLAIQRIDTQSTSLGRPSSQCSVQTKQSSIHKRRDTQSPVEQNASLLYIPSLKRIVSTNSQQNVTKVLLLISTIFICLNLPSYFIRLYFYALNVLEKEVPTEIYCVQQFTMMLFYTNFSVNFVLYAMYGITFRNCLKQLIWNLLRRNCCRFK
ncbi:thyrotropin-releasing hormone receptor isoform X2 [Agrilus planipennis]|uniref:Thyrotropin-releasing hormone receptor isoform X2 n=1 Tax=Agrilus planipennis TaxID=224129 RepID=A0A1W4X6Z8_AGRPL|nr:thyrotropin-releasing hormone receptor isoform X2 [Agrilus planipennis]